MTLIEFFHVEIVSMQTLHYLTLCILIPPLLDYLLNRALCSMRAVLPVSVRRLCTASDLHNLNDMQE